MQTWVQGTVVETIRWNDELYSVRIDAPVQGFEAGQFTKIGLDIGGLTMRLKCPHDPKPMCKKCETQCYKGEYKEKIREIMKFSGIYMIKHGRVDMLYHYFI